MMNNENPTEHPAWPVAESLWKACWDLNGIQYNGTDFGGAAYKGVHDALEQTLEQIFVDARHEPADAWTEEVLAGAADSGESLTYQYRHIVDQPAYGRGGDLRR